MYKSEILIYSSVMKHIVPCVVLVFFMFGGNVLFSQDKSSSLFVQTYYDFGEVKKGDTVSYVFNFRNNTDGPLSVVDVVTQCGCTTSREKFVPVYPGDTGEVEVTFNTSDKSGFQRKTINVKFDNFLSEKLVIIANVVE